MSLIQHSEPAPPPYSAQRDTAPSLPTPAQPAEDLPAPSASNVIVVVQDTPDRRAIGHIADDIARHNRKAYNCQPKARENLPSPFEKASKTKVTNFREGVNEGAKCAWAEVREGAKAPAVLVWDGLKRGGVFGAVGGIVGGAIEVVKAPFAATIVFVNHSSRGVIRGRRAANAEATSSPFTSETDSPNSPVPSYAPETKSGLEHDPALSTVEAGSSASAPRGESAMVAGEGIAREKEEDASPIEMDAKWGAGR